LPKPASIDIILIAPYTLGVNASAAPSAPVTQAAINLGPESPSPARFAKPPKVLAALRRSVPLTSFDPIARPAGAPAREFVDPMLSPHARQWRGGLVRLARRPEA
jgi:hypothetical protein